MGCGESKIVVMEKMEILRSTPFYLYFSEEDLEGLAKYFEIKIFQEGDIIVREGDQVLHFHVINSGEVKLYVKQKAVKDNVMSHSTLFRGDQSQNVNYLHPTRGYEICTKGTGDFFGERAILQDGSLRNATGPCKCLEISKSNLSKYLQNHSQQLKAVHSIMGNAMEDNLMRVPLFNNVPAETLNVLGTLFHYRSLKTHHTLFKEGDRGNAMFIVYAGEVECFVVRDGKEKVLGQFSHGNFFGEIALMIDMPRTASIRAVQPSLLLELRKKDCYRMLRMVPELANNFDHLMKERTAEHFRKYNVPFFKAIPDDMYANLALLCEIEEVQKDTVIFQQDSVGHKFYIIVHGEVNIFAHTMGRKEELYLCSMGPGKYFGEIALVRETPRTATVIAKNRCILLTITKDNFDRFFEQCPEALADFKVKIAKYDISLKDFLYHPTGVSYFTKHLEMEYSVENINFWRDCCKYQEIDNDEERSTFSTFIVDEYIKQNSPQQVNLRSKNVKECMNLYEQGILTPTLFDNCQEEILALMNTDSFMRFKQSSLFQEFLTATDSYVDVEAKQKEADEKRKTDTT